MRTAAQPPQGLGWFYCRDRQGQFFPFEEGEGAITCPTVTFGPWSSSLHCLPPDYKVAQSVRDRRSGEDRKEIFFISCGADQKQIDLHGSVGDIERDFSDDHGKIR